MPNSSSAWEVRNLPILGLLLRQIEAAPKPLPEDSILLRIMVQALVIVGIIAVDVAAGVATDELPLTFWAAPLSIIGAIWSWYNRYKRNVPAKFCLAIGMLLALAAFLSRLVGELNDTRLVLAELLIQLQVLHSFDLPRRKDLGYSMVIGLILLGVAGTISQTLTYGPVLLLFIILAIPCLILDYRSRLGLQSKFLGNKSKFLKQKQRQKLSLLNATLSPKRLTILLLVIIGLGLAIFAFLPRLPGYQLRTFPVSAPINFDVGNFDGRTITNPGYIGQGRENGDGSGNSNGTNQESGPGTLDTTYYYGFNTKINQNLRGQLEPQVVMRVRSQAEGFWRVLAFDKYTGEGWEISRNDNTFTLNRPRWSYQFDVKWGRNNYANETQEVIQSYTVVSQLPNLIPALYNARELYFPTEKIAIDPDGNLRSPLELREGLTYTVISDVPYRNPTILGKAGTNYPKSISQYYLQIPPEIAEKVRKKTEEILASKNKVAKDSKPITSPYQKALYLAQELKQDPNYKLQKTPPFLAEGEDLVSAFLFGYQNSPEGEKITGGYGDHFSTVLTIMLRSIGIPARLVGGYAPGEFNPFTGLYVVKNTDAYMMTEVYFPGYGWFAFNPIPGMPLIPPSIEKNQTFTALMTFWKWVAGWLPSPVTGFLERFIDGIFRWILGIIGWFFALFSQGWQGIFRGLILATALSFLGWLLYIFWRKWRYGRWLARLSPMESIYQQMLSLMASKGLVKRGFQTPFEYTKAIQEYNSINEVEIIEEISQAYVGWRYGSKEVNLTRLKKLLRSLKRSIKRRLN
ncbi:transglutaminase TgpA family protein [Dapis sp. BLCC M229]|uniref:transglutaminase TgpA family protein n=1 Tax=Dapis sp. BLCC M229 TaxID=3400188 RepID=UPI003CF5BBB5